jgi:hypothetical protein
MKVLTFPTMYGVSTLWADIKAAVARGLKRSIDARMNQIRHEIEMGRVHSRTPRDDGAQTAR